jgi:hypothetical protein
MNKIKPGDLCLITRSRAGHEGKVVKAVRFVGRVYGWNGFDRWEIDRGLMGIYGNVSNTFRGEWMRPIRDPGDDAQDESLLWAPAPEKVTA